MIYQIDITEDQERVIQTICDKLGYSFSEGISQIIEDTVDSLKYSQDLFHQDADAIRHAEVQSVIHVGRQGAGKTVTCLKLLHSFKNSK